MNVDEFQALKRREEEKRERCWDPLQRWLALQETITWAESQATVQRNTPKKCLERERAILAAMAQIRPPTPQPSS
jgi:hypothetical protein